MPLSPPADSAATYYPPAILSWHIGDGSFYIELPISLDLCNFLEDEDLVTIAETVETRLKTQYPEYKIVRFMTWKPSAPVGEIRFTVQDAPPQEPEPDPQEQGQ
ncbi:hypothetical protein ACFV6B_12735 [Streptomyces microflavus]|uniref:hypothetical protein n=1 Tax=Streptomyces microflavus TaxID=1919 RepID=UPI003648C91F